jgi:hypothetical protein
MKAKESPRREKGRVGGLERVCIVGVGVVEMDGCGVVVQSQQDP